MSSPSSSGRGRCPRHGSKGRSCARRSAGETGSALRSCLGRRIMTERDRRALLLGGAIVLGAVLLLRVLPWGVRRVLAAEAELRDRGALLARARADLAEAALLRDSAAALSQALVGLAPKLLSGATPAEAAADLSGRINLAASQSAAKLERVDQVPDSGVAGRG